MLPGSPPPGAPVPEGAAVGGTLSVKDSLGKAGVEELSGAPPLGPPPPSVAA